MARGAVFLNVEGELFDVFAIKSIRRFEYFKTSDNGGESGMRYGLIINEEVHSDAPFRDVKFEYPTEEVREAKLLEIKVKLEGFEYIMILN